MAQLYGLLAEFDQPNPLQEAAKRTYDAGYRKMDAYSPFPIEGLAETLGNKSSKLPFLVFLGGLAGAVGGFGMQYVGSVVFYPYLVGGKPLNSWPAFIPITFETTVLLAALTAVIAMIALNGLPQPYHPVFNAPNFAAASQDKFFLCLEADDPKFNLAEARRFLEGLQPLAVTEVEHWPDEPQSAS